MAEQARTIWRGFPRAIRVLVDTTEDTTDWDLVWRAGRTKGSPASLELALTRQSASLFTATLTAAQSQSLETGAILVFVVRTNAGAEDVLGTEQYVVDDPVLATE